MILKLTPEELSSAKAIILKEKYAKSFVCLNQPDMCAEALNGLEFLEELFARTIEGDEQISLF